MIALVSGGILVYAILSVTSLSLPYKLGADCFKASGAELGFALGYYVERRYIDFDTRTKNLFMQILKLVVGVALAILIKDVPKKLFPDNMAADTLRYFLAVVWVLVLYPLIIKKFFAVKKD